MIIKSMKVSLHLVVFVFFAILSLIIQFSQTEIQAFQSPTPAFSPELGDLFGIDEIIPETTSWSDANNILSSRGYSVIESQFTPEVYLIKINNPRQFDTTSNIDVNVEITTAFNQVLSISILFYRGELFYGIDFDESMWRRIAPETFVTLYGRPDNASVILNRRGDGGTGVSMFLHWVQRGISVRYAAEAYEEPDYFRVCINRERMKTVDVFLTPPGTTMDDARERFNIRYTDVLRPTFNDITTLESFTQELRRETCMNTPMALWVTIDPTPTSIPTISPTPT